MQPDRIIAEFVDIAGGFVRTGNWQVAGSSLASYLLALEAATFANLATLVHGAPNTGNPPASSSLYPLVTTTAVLNWVTGAGTGVQTTIPAPDASIFAADGVTVDPTTVKMVALIAATVGFLTDSAGNVVTAFVQGVKSSRKVEQSG